jgi:dihydrofolate synthase / folylpolyglutamate synthase
MSLTPGGMREGRDNILKLMNILGNPQDTLQVFHVTGSNGKWSVCQMISQVLWKTFWKKVGLFTSPYFLRINEQFQINGIPIKDTLLDTYYSRIIELSEKYIIPLSSFEIQVITMILYFIDEKVDYAVVEVGLGGTYDGTNIFTRPIACFITSITLEHTHVLGKTKNSILKNKLWIVKPETHLYTWIDNQKVHQHCSLEKVSLYSPSSWELKYIQTNLPGKHQEKNAGLVFLCLRHLWFEEEKIKKWLLDIYNPGRFEWITPTILVDTANNKENIEILRKMTENVLKNKKTTVLFGTTQTDPIYAKKLSTMISGTKNIVIDDFCERSLPCSEYMWVNEREILHFFHEPEKIRALLKNTDTIKIIYGSFYLIRGIMRESRYIPFASQ